MPTDAARRASLVNRIEAARQTAAKLTEQLSDPAMKEWVRRTVYELDDVRRLYLDDPREDHAEAHEARWLDGAALHVRIAEATLSQIQQAVADYGPFVQLRG